MIKGDFSPDNLMLQPDGTVIMTDINGFSGFRAPYSAAKQGCSPIEQYVRDGVCGPWTDVYAVCATFCFCLTGVMPPTARERVNGAKPALQTIDKAFAGVLEKGLALQPGDRIQSMGELRGELQAALQRLLAALARLVGEYGMPEGMRKGQVNPFYPDHLIRQCRKIILELTVTRLSGHPYGRFYIFAKDLNGNWEHIALFEMEERQKNGETVTYTLELEKPESFVALALFPEENGMDFVARFDCVYYVDPDCLEEYSDSVRRPDYTPAGGEHSVYLLADGRVTASGKNYHGETEVGDWTEIGIGNLQ